MKVVMYGEKLLKGETSPSYYNIPASPVISSSNFITSVRLYSLFSIRTQAEETTTVYLL